MSTVNVTARKWSGGWDLIIDDDNATSARYLHDAVDQVRDYLDTLDPAVDHSGTTINVYVDIGPLGKKLQEVRKGTADAAAAQEAAAAKAREFVRQLREQGFSVSDIADLLGVSKGRVSQLASGWQAPDQPLHLPAYQARKW